MYVGVIVSESMHANVSEAELGSVYVCVPALVVYVCTARACGACAYAQ